MVEQWTENPCVVGPIPTGGSWTVENYSAVFFYIRTSFSPLVRNVFLPYNYGNELADYCP